MAISKQYRRFGSESAVREFIKRRENKKFTLSTQKSKKITENIQKTRKFKLKNSLGYAHMRFQCLQGGACVEKLKGEERQRKHESKKIGCPAFFNFLPSKKGQALELRKFNLVHTCRKQKEQDLEMTPSNLWSSIDDTTTNENESNSHDYRRHRSSNDQREATPTNISSDELNDSVTQVPDSYQDFVAHQQIFNSTINEKTNAISIVNSVYSDGRESNSQKSCQDVDSSSDLSIENIDKNDISSQLEKCQISNQRAKKNKRITFNTSFKLNMSKEREKKRKIMSIESKKEERNKKIKIYDIGVNSKKFELDLETKLDSVKISTPKKCKGRPKGRKNIKKKKQTEKYVEKSKKFKTEHILSCLFGETIAKKTIKNNARIISNELPEKGSTLPDFFHDEDVKAEDVENYFEKKAFKKLVRLIKEKRTSRIFTCFGCAEKIKKNDDSIGCDACLYWFHLQCVEVPDTLKDEDPWFCDVCEE